MRTMEIKDIPQLAGKKIVKAKLETFTGADWTERARLLFSMDDGSVVEVTADGRVDVAVLS